MWKKINNKTDLPNEGLHVIIKYHDNQLGFGYWEYCHDINVIKEYIYNDKNNERDEYHWCLENNARVYDVTHWMPSPELPVENKIDYEPKCICPRNRIIPIITSYKSR